MLTLDAPFGHTPQLIEIAETIQERRGPWIATAGGVACFGDPQRFAGLELIAKTCMKSLDAIHSGEPLLRERRPSSCCCRGPHRRAPFRNRSVGMVREGIEHRSSGLQQILGLSMLTDGGADNIPSPTEPGPRNTISGAISLMKGRKTAISRLYAATS